MNTIPSYLLPETIIIGDANLNINNCLPIWEQEQKELVNKISFENTVTTDHFRIAGADISWDKRDTTSAVGSMIVHEYPTLKPLCQISVRCKIYVPYKAGFLGFREVPIYLKLVEVLRQNHPECVPDLVLIDGNGVWHPRGCGAASHFSVLSGIPAIGVAKKVLFADGMDRINVEELLKNNAANKDDSVMITGKSGRMLGYAYNSSGSIKKAIYVSVGSMISLDRALEIVRSINKYHVSEVIRQTDKLSRILVKN